MRKFELSDFKRLSASLAEDAIELLTHLDERLLLLVEKELATGNKIGRVSKGWRAKMDCWFKCQGK